MSLSQVSQCLSCQRGCGLEVLLPHLAAVVVDRVEVHRQHGDRVARRLGAVYQRDRLREGAPQRRRCPVTMKIARPVSLTCDEESSLSIHGRFGVRFDCFLRALGSALVTKDCFGWALQYPVSGKSALSHVGGS